MSTMFDSYHGYLQGRTALAAKLFYQVTAKEVSREAGGIASCVDEAKSSLMRRYGLDCECDKEDPLVKKVMECKTHADEIVKKVWQVPFSEEDVHFRDFDVGEVVGELRCMLPSEGIQYVVDGGSFQIRSIRKDVYFCLAELLMNSIEALQGEGKIYVGIHQESEGEYKNLVICVNDSYEPGKEELNAILGNLEGQELPGITTREYRSRLVPRGLGLMLVRHLCSNIGTRFEYDVDKGFRLVLPIV